MPSYYTFPLSMRPYRSLSCNMRARRFLSPTIPTRRTLSVTNVTSLVFIFDLHLSALRLLRRQLVRQLRPLAFDHGSHLIGDVVDVLDIEHVLAEEL